MAYDDGIIGYKNRLYCRVFSGDISDKHREHVEFRIRQWYDAGKLSANQPFIVHITHGGCEGNPDVPSYIGIGVFDPDKNEQTIIVVQAGESHDLFNLIIPLKLSEPGVLPLLIETGYDDTSYVLTAEI